MQKISYKEYKKFLTENYFINIANTKFKLASNNKIFEIEPNNFDRQTTSVWSFPNRGRWATHYLNARYRGNWAPQVARNLILQYSMPKDIILDPFVGSGTTLIEAKLLNRNAIGIDINIDAIMLSWNRLDFTFKNYVREPSLYVGDARSLKKIPNNSIDLVLTHPPYANIITYTVNKVGDLSQLSYEQFIIEINKFSKEMNRLLKVNKFCAILIGDIRKKNNYIPISNYLLQSFLSNGFILKEQIIKIQHNTQSDRFWVNKSITKNFYLIHHEHLFIFRKVLNSSRTT